MDEIGGSHEEVEANRIMLDPVGSPSVTPNAASLHPNFDSHAELAHHSVDQEEDAEDDNRLEDFLRSPSEDTGVCEKKIQNAEESTDGFATGSVDILQGGADII